MENDVNSIKFRAVVQKRTKTHQKFNPDFLDKLFDWLLGAKQQWRIQDFPEGGAPTPKSVIIFQLFCRKLHENVKKNLDSRRASLAPPWIRQWSIIFEEMGIVCNWYEISPVIWQGRGYWEARRHMFTLCTEETFIEIIQEVELDHCYNIMTFTAYLEHSLM